jgi:hypothetical protein
MLPKATPFCFLVAALLGPMVAANDVLTYHNDNARTGLNFTEGILTPENVNVNSFGKLFVLPVDGKVDAQPLYVSSVPIFGLGRRNLIIVATEHDTVYGFDADNGVLYWKTSLLRPGEVPSDNRGCSQVTPEIGVTATPVIDRNVGAYGRIYVVAMSKDVRGVYHQRLHALGLPGGWETQGSPVEIRASFPGAGPGNDGQGHVHFNPAQYKERPGLLLLNGVIYTTWSSHCDISPYTAWIIGYDEQSLTQAAVLNINPNGYPNSSFLSDGSGSAFWNSGAGPAADPQGFIYAISGNGPFDARLVNGFPRSQDYGDSVLKLSTIGGLSVADYFTPFDQASDAAGDRDLGSGGVMLVDLQARPNLLLHLAIGAGKDGNIYVVNRNHLGKINLVGGANSNIHQEIPNALPGGEFGMPAYSNGSVYYGPVGSRLRQFQFFGGALSSSPISMTATQFGYPGTTPSVSSFYGSNAIVWAYENAAGGTAVLHAYDGANLGVELYNSEQNTSRDRVGSSNKFIVPTICNGKVYAATTNSVAVFGLLNSAAAQDVTSSVGVARQFLLYNPLTGAVLESITLTNISAEPIAAPLSLVFDYLSNRAYVKYSPGATTVAAPTGSSFIDFWPEPYLAPGQSIRENVVIHSPSTAIFFRARVLAGDGTR